METFQQPTPNPALKQLDALVGEWEMQASVGGQPMVRGRTAFAWVEGGAFLVQHADAESALPNTPPEWGANSPFPITSLFGLDDVTGRITMLYADGRGICRVYQMNLSDGVWKIWREAPKFFQRFTSTFSDDGTTITGHWERSRDGAHWEHDFDLTYTKIR